MPLSDCTGDGGGGRRNLQGSDASVARAGRPGVCESPACSQEGEENEVRAFFLGLSASGL